MTIRHALLTTMIIGYLATGLASAQTSSSSNTSDREIPMNTASPILSPDLKDAIKTILRNHPELILDILNEHDVDMADLVQRGLVKKKRQAEQNRIMAELAAPKIPDLQPTRPMRGNPEAPITIVEYSDFQCPYCGAVYATVKRLLQQYEGRIRFIYKHYPLDFHPLAEPAARYFEAIALQDPEQAWTFHDLVFEFQKSLTDETKDLKTIVASLPIDHEQLQQDLNSAAVTQRIEHDKQEAQQFGFTGTPAFLINGVSLVGNRPQKNFTDIIELTQQDQQQEQHPTHLSDPS